MMHYEEMADAIKRRFNGIEGNKHVAIATLINPHFKDKFFWICKKENATIKQTLK